MRPRKSSLLSACATALKGALLSSSLITLLGAPAFGQGARSSQQTDNQLIVKLHELARAKGAYVKRDLGPDFCRRLGVRPIGFCEAFRLQFDTDGRPAATFYSLDDGRDGKPRIFITTLLEPGYVDDFRVDFDGRLERAVRRRGGTSSHLAVKDTTAEFRRAMEFLRSRQDAFADLPDARVMDDGSCPKGQLKRVVTNPSNSVCVDAVRLKSP